MEIVLSGWCSTEDICTPLTPADEALRLRYGGSARNDRDPEGAAKFYNHMPASEVRRLLPKLWDGAYRFTIDRHPYEKVVSQAWWRVGRQRGDPDEDIPGAIEQIVASGSYLNFPLYTIGGALAVDEVIRHEEMWPRLSAIAQGFGRRIPTSKPAAKTGFRRDRRPASDILSAAQKARIRADAAFEFDLLGYEP